MEVDERPTEQYVDIGGLDKQIQEVCYISISFVDITYFLLNTKIISFLAHWSCSASHDTQRKIS